MNFSLTSKRLRCAYLDMRIDDVLGSSSPSPFAFGYLFDFGRLPSGVIALGMIPEKYQTVAFNNRI